MPFLQGRAFTKFAKIFKKNEFRVLYQYSTFETSSIVNFSDFVHKLLIFFSLFGILLCLCFNQLCIIKVIDSHSIFYFA